MIVENARKKDSSLFKYNVINRFTVNYEHNTRYPSRI